MYVAREQFKVLWHIFNIIFLTYHAIDKKANHLEDKRKLLFPHLTYFSSSISVESGTVNTISMGELMTWKVPYVNVRVFGGKQ